MEAKRLADSALSTMMAGTGAAAGAPPPSQLTRADLHAALADLETDVLDPIWGQQASAVSASLQAISQGLEEVWTAMRKWQDQGDDGLADDMQTKAWIADTWTYFDVDAVHGVLMTLRTYRSRMEQASFNDASLTPAQLAARLSRTTGLYSWISSLTISYLKAAVIWTWGWQRREAKQYHAYRQALSQWNAHDAAYHANHPLTALQAHFPGLNLDPGYVPPEWNTWRNMPGCPVPVLIQEVQNIVNYGAQIAPGPDAQLDPLVQAIRRAAADVDFVFYTVVEGDTLTGLAQSNFNDPALAQRLFALNSPPLTDANVLSGGTKLKIYGKDALPWAPPAGETYIQDV